MNTKKIDMLLNKIMHEYIDLIHQFEKGHSETDYSLIFEELQFLKVISDNCISDDRFNTIIDYFLNNDYKVTKF